MPASHYLFSVGRVNRVSWSLHVRKAFSPIPLPLKGGKKSFSCGWKVEVCCTEVCTPGHWELSIRGAWITVRSPSSPPFKTKWSPVGSSELAPTISHSVRDSSAPHQHGPGTVFTACICHAYPSFAAEGLSNPIRRWKRTPPGINTGCTGGRQG